MDHDPFDLVIQDEVMPLCHETKQIFHAWNTGNYQLVENQVIGRDLGPNKGRYGGRPIPGEAVMLHGVKDASLYKIDFETRKKHE